MKFSTTTALAVLASSVAVQAAPIDAAQAAQAQFASSTELTFVKKSDAAQIKSIIAEISHINKKREFTEDPAELAELEKRATSALGNLISAFLSSGIITDVFETLTTDSAVRSSIEAILSSVLSTVVSNGPQLLTAIWNSGLLSKIFTDFTNDSNLGSALVAAIPELLQDALSLLGLLTGTSTSSSSSSTTSTAAAKKRQIVDMADLTEDEYLTKRDLSSIITWVIQEIQSSGIITTLINNFLANPTQYLTQIGNILSTVFSVGEQIFNWAKSSGILSSVLTWLENNGGSILGTLAKIVSSLLGSSTTSTTSATTTTAAAAAATTAAIGVQTTTTHTTTTKSVAATGVNAVFLAAQAANKRRRNY